MGSICAATAICWARSALNSVVRTRSTQQRLFSCSTILFKKAGVPKFTEVSSPELQKILERIRLEHFLPSHYSDYERSQLSKLKYRKQLEAEPLTITVAGEEFKMNQSQGKGRVPVATTVAKALALMKERKDYDNIPMLLRGYHEMTNLGKPARENVQTRCIRQIVLAGYQEVLLECLRRGAETGLVMKEHDIAKRIFQGIASKAYSPDAGEKDVKKALLWAEQAAVLLENEEHAGSTPLNGEDDPRTSHTIIGILLELAVKYASKHAGGKDEDGKVAQYVERYCNVPLNLPPVPTISGKNLLDNFKFSRQHFMATARVAEALDGALTILPGSKYTQELNSRIETLKQDMVATRDVMNSILEAREKEGKAFFVPDAYRMYGHLIESR